MVGWAEAGDLGDRLECAFARERIAPLVQELGLPMPEIREYDIHATLSP